MRVIYITILNLIGLQCVMAQTGVIEGNLFSKVEGPGFGGHATVRIVDTALGTNSGADGYFLIKNIPEGTYRVIIECVGYRDTTISQVRVNADQVSVLNLNFPIGCHVLQHRGKLCPYCERRDAAIPIVYGMPDQRLMRKAKNGKVRLAGCQLTGCDPQWYCKRDEQEF